MFDNTIDVSSTLSSPVSGVVSTDIISPEEE